MKSALSADVLAQLHKIGLDPQRVALHHRRIVTQLQAQQGAVAAFPLVQACRIDNGRIFPLETVASTTVESAATVVAMVLAAGVSSRYFQSYPDLHAIQPDRLHAEARRVVNSKMALLPALRDALQKVLQEESPSVETRHQLHTLLALPKALQACKSNGRTFLAHKLQTQAAFSFLLGQVVVTPPNFRANFQQEVPAAEQPPILWETQDAALSTLRFDLATGEPVRDATGALSPVPAGHGVLLEKFTAIRTRFPEVKTVWIHNIDNTGTGDPAVASAFVHFHETLRKEMEQIREHVREGALAIASSLAEMLVARFPVRDLSFEEQAVVAAHVPAEQPLWRLLLLLFQMPLLRAGAPSLLSLLERPVNVLGVVRNLGTDAGGAPVVVQTQQGEVALCLEIPHVAEESRAIFSDPQQVTHFNPVYICAECVDPAVYQGEHPYWLLARKKWQGQTVGYHETLLSELVGNTELANAVFVEVPRQVFHPHKGIEDTIRLVP